VSRTLATTWKCWPSAAKQHPEASRTRTVRPEEEYTPKRLGAGAPRGPVCGSVYRAFSLCLLVVAILRLLIIFKRKAYLIHWYISQLNYDN